jgi:N-acetylmuramic acid 6-phosphate etherase
MSAIASADNTTRNDGTKNGIDHPVLARVHSTQLKDGAGPEYDLRTTAELVDLINRQDLAVPSAVRLAAPSIERAIDAIVERLAQGGRLVYVGAGSSGRLAELDAFECAATFGVQDGEIVALVAAGLDAEPLAAAAAEDDYEAGAADVLSLTLSEADVVVGVSASGETRYVSGALSAASRAGALTIALVCTTGSEHAALADQAIEVSVGPELISGSTRLKAGTAQKLVLNTISTISMVAASVSAHPAATAGTTTAGLNTAKAAATSCPGTCPSAEPRLQK